MKKCFSLFISLLLCLTLAGCAAAEREEDAALRKNPVLTKKLIDRLIERIDVSPDKSLRIRWTFRNEYGEEDTPCQPM